MLYNMGMKIYGKDAITVLEQKRPEETLIHAAKRLFPEKYESLIPEKVDRIRNETVNEATKKRYQEDFFREMCPNCWRKLVRATFQEFGRKCLGCGSKDYVTAHHIIPRDEQGADRVFNLMPLCDPCHDYVESHESRPRTRENCIRVAYLRLT